MTEGSSGGASSSSDCSGGGDINIWRRTNRILAEHKEEGETFSGIYLPIVRDLMNKRDTFKSSLQHHLFRGVDDRLKFNMEDLISGWDTRNCMYVVPQQQGWPHGSITLQLNEDSFITVLEGNGAFVGLLDQKWFDDLGDGNLATFIQDIARKLAN
jgi:hypothetical protein